MTASDPIPDADPYAQAVADPSTERFLDGQRFLTRLDIADRIIWHREDKDEATSRARSSAPDPVAEI